MGYKDTPLPKVGEGIGAIGTHAGNIAGAAKETGRIGKGTGGLLGAAGNFASGFGKFMGGEDVGQGFLEMGGGILDFAATETKNPWVGAAGPALRGASAGVTMYQNRDQCGVDAPMADNKCYTAMGDAAFAGMEVAYPVAGSVAKLALDGVGALAGWIDEDYGFSSGSVVGGAIHGGARGASAGIDAVSSLFPKAVEFSPTGVPMTKPGMKDYTAPDPLEALEAGVAADPDTWPTTYQR